MKEKSIFARIFGSGERTPRVNPVSEATRERVIADAEEIMASQRPVDAWADALNKADERRQLESIARLRGSEQLPKQVEKVFKQAVTAGLSSMLDRRGIYFDLIEINKVSDILWHTFKASLLRGKSWLERADARDKSPLTEQEKTFFEKGGAQ